MRISRHNDSEYWHLQRFNADQRRADKGPPEREETDLAGDPILDAFSEDEFEPPKGSFDEDGNFLYDE
jgi:hypothetical protein